MMTTIAMMMMIMMVIGPLIHELLRAGAIFVLFIAVVQHLVLSGTSIHFNLIEQ